MLTPYRAQQALIRELLASEDVAVLTFDSAQGHEYDVVYVSFVTDYNSKRFAFDANRLCVALSRAKQRLILACSGRAIFQKSLKRFAKVAMAERSRLERAYASAVSLDATATTKAKSAQKTTPNPKAIPKPKAKAIPKPKAKAVPKGKAAATTEANADAAPAVHSTLLKKLVEGGWGSTLKYVLQTSDLGILRSRVQTTLPDHTVYAGPWSDWRDAIEPSSNMAQTACEEQAAERALPELYAVSVRT